MGVALGVALAVGVPVAVSTAVAVTPGVPFVPGVPTAIGVPATPDPPGGIAVLACGTNAVGAMSRERNGADTADTACGSASLTVPHSSAGIGCQLLRAAISFEPPPKERFGTQR